MYRGNNITICGNMNPGAMYMDSGVKSLTLFFLYYGSIKRGRPAYRQLQFSSVCNFSSHPRSSDCSPLMS